MTSTLPAPRNLAPHLSLQIAGSALILGLLADALFNGAALGLNVPLWTGTFIGAFVLVARRNRTPVSSWSASLLAISLGLSITVAWRSEPLLQLLLLTTSAVLLLLSLVTRHHLRARAISITAFFMTLAVGVLSIARGIYLLPSVLGWRTWLQRDARQHAQAVGRASLIATLLLLVFGALFFSADAVFENWITDAFTIDLTSLVRHIAWLIAGTAVAAGLLWCGLAAEQAIPVGPQLAEKRRLRSLETGLVLGSLAALFALFVVIQLQYLFGGADRVQASTGLTYADYARRGFFELVAVAALLLPVLLAVDWARTRNRRSRATYRALSGLLVMLLMVVVISAFQRMRIYMDVYGLTSLRFYVSATLAWLATVFVWLLWSLLKERRDEFIFGAATTALVALIVLVSVNPHGTIAATNLARAEQGRDFDTPYALGLSADATPTLVTGVDLLPPDDACQLATTLLDRWDNPDSELRSWNWARTSAAAAVESNRHALQSACG